MAINQLPPSAQAQRQIILKAAQGENISPQEIIDAILALEKHKLIALDSTQLTGKWRLLWTSGTTNYQKIQGNKLPQIRKNSNIKQCFIGQQLANEVSFPGGNLTVAGSFNYTQQQRIEFTFEQLKIELKLFSLPTLTLPMGKWAKGWLQTTYLDEKLHIERGNRGGVSVFVKD